MSKFKVSDLVWIDWCPAEYLGDKDARLRQGIVRGYVGIRKFAQFGEEMCYRVEVQGMGLGNAAESGMRKIPPEEEHGRKTKSKNKERPETV